MARSTIKDKRQMESKFYIYIITFIIFGSLTLFLWLFGFDLGFFKYEGKANSTIVWILFILGLMVEYIVDIKYCKISKEYTSSSKSILDYVPFINTILGFNKIYMIIFFSLTGIMVLLILILFTPLLILFPSHYILKVSSICTSGFVVCGLAIIILRGYDQLVTKKYVLIDCEKLSGEQGAGSKFSNIMQSMLYFLPILRISSLIQDIQLIQTVGSLIDLDNKLEGSDS